jgi:uncharacterized protein (TIGR02757 family)
VKRTHPSLKPVLDRLYRDFNHAAAATDPIHIVRRYPDPADREVVGFCAAGLAFGRVAGILQSVERLVAPMGAGPAAFVRGFDPDRDRHGLDRLGHRWTRGPDLVALLWILRQMLERAGSIERFFLEGHAAGAADVTAGLESFSRRSLDFDLKPAYGRVPERPGVAYFFSRPSDGSACKRLNLFLRWMVRRDAVDLGVWSGIAPSQLIVPLDTHVVRVGRCLGLTRRTSPGWKMAAEITASLRAINPADPVRYDFSLCHVAMQKTCGFDGSCSDEACPLQGFCQPARSRRTRRS